MPRKECQPSNIQMCVFVFDWGSETPELTSYQGGGSTILPGVRGRSCDDCVTEVFSSLQEIGRKDEMLIER
jgi:hypothetical protein